jgi:anti-anti-sigma factor
MDFHTDPVVREAVIGGYLRRGLDPQTLEAFESHYLDCDECFEELRATGLLVAGLMAPAVDRRHIGAVAYVEFKRPVQLTRESRNLTELARNVLEQNDTKVLIDLSRVSRIDSAGLGMLMACYSHLVRQHGELKLLKPAPQVRSLLRMTKVDCVLESYDDERAAIDSFQSPQS